MRSQIRIAAIAVVLAAAGPARADLTLNFFGDINYVVEHEGTTSNTFQAAALDIFASQTEGKFSFIGEMLIEAFGTNSFEQDVNRLEVAYKPTAWLRFRAGRLRSAFGYYGDAYQNGKYFMTPVTWPEMYEGDGFDGILPSHAIGVHGDVAYELGDERGKLTVDAEVLNGRGNGLDDVPVFQDGNNGKAVNLRLRYVGAGTLDGLVIGGNVYIDDIPSSTSELSDDSELAHPAIHELVLGGHAAYVTDRVHAISELAWFRHRAHGDTMTIDTLAVFGELGYKLEDFTPYSRFEYMRFAQDEDLYFAASGIPHEDIRLWSLGVKYAASASVAVKLEGAADFWAGHGHVLAQAAFAF